MVVVLLNGGSGMWTNDVINSFKNSKRKDAK